MDLQAIIDKASREALAIHEKAASEKRDMTTDERAEFDALSAKALSLKNDADEAKAAEAEAKAKADADAKTLASLKALGEHVATETKATETKATETKLRGRISLGKAYVDNPVIRKAMEAGFGSASDVAALPAINTGISLKSIVAERKALVLSPAVGIEVELENRGPRVFTLMDLMQIVPVGRDSLRVSQLTSVNNAAVVAEGVLKPEGTMTFTQRTLTPEVIAQWVPITMQAMEDFDTMEALISTELAENVIGRIEVEAALDLAVVSGMPLQAFTTDVVTSIRNGIKLLHNIGVYPDVCIMSADEAANLDLLKDTVGQYINAGPFGVNDQRVWRLKVVPTPALPNGFCYVGNANQLVWRERSPITVRTGWTGTQFVENELTILAECRGILDVRRPANWVKVDTIL